MVLPELGSNDALRGLPLGDDPEEPARHGGRWPARPAPRVLLVGMMNPPNYARPRLRRTSFAAGLFPAVARAENAGLVPFLMDGIATDRAMFQADGHPQRKRTGPARLLDNVWAALEADAARRTQHPAPTLPETPEAVLDGPAGRCPRASNRRAPRLP